MEKQSTGNSPLAKLRPIETKRASEAIYDQIKDLIISGQLAPGDRLPSERNMVEMLQRSRPTIREALRMLERSGFIRTMPGTNGAIVQHPSTDGMEQSLEVMLHTSNVSLSCLAEYRKYNDTAVARWAAQRRTAEDIQALRQLLDETSHQIEQGLHSGFAKTDFKFHSQLAVAAQNQMSLIITRVMSKMVEPILLHAIERQTDAENAAMFRKIVGMHTKIYEAVSLGDADAAEQAMAHHIQVFEEDLTPLQDAPPL